MNMSNGMINVDGAKIFYSPDTMDLDNTPSRDMFGYLIASQGLTIHTSPIDVVETLYELKRMSTTYSSYINTILLNIIVSDSLDDYMDILTDEPYKFITSDGEVVSVKDLSWI
jgi:ABC-type proline/glycine betaine transport system ATPase subunit